MRVARPVVLSPEQARGFGSSSACKTCSGSERGTGSDRPDGGRPDAGHKQIADRLRITPEKAGRWRNRFLDGGLAALDKDAPRPGRTPKITPAKIQEVIRKTTREKPATPRTGAPARWPRWSV